MIRARRAPSNELFQELRRMSPAHHNFLFHTLFRQLYDAVGNCRRVTVHIDEKRIDDLKWLAATLEGVLDFCGGNHIVGESGPSTWNVRLDRLSCPRMHAFWESKWTTDLKRKIVRYCKSIRRIVCVWRGNQDMTGNTFAAFRVFLKHCRLLQYLVLRTLRMKYNPKAENQERFEAAMCWCLHCENLLA